MGEPWRSTAPATAPPWGTPPGITPTGDWPASVGDPLLLPHVDRLPREDIGAPLGAPGFLFGFKLPITGGNLANRPKLIDWVVWNTYTSTFVSPFRVSLVLTMWPQSDDFFTAYNAGRINVLDSCLNPTGVPVVRGAWDPPLWVPPGYDVQLLTQDGFFGGLSNQACSAQWRLV